MSCGIVLALHTANATFAHFFALRHMGFDECAVFFQQNLHAEHNDADGDDDCAENECL